MFKTVFHESIKNSTRFFLSVVLYYKKYDSVAAGNGSVNCKRVNCLIDMIDKCLGKSFSKRIFKVLEHDQKAGRHWRDFYS